MTEIENKATEGAGSQVPPPIIATSTTPDAPPLSEQQAPTTTPSLYASYASETLPEQSESPITDNVGQGITWTASEFVRHDKSSGWYMSLVVSTLLLAGLMFLITKDAISVAVVLVAGIVLGIYASHKPRQLEYRVNNRGIFVGNKYYSYEDYKSFSVMPEGAFSSISFMPLKRFASGLTIYFAPNDEDRIIAILADQLPEEEARPDAIDNLMRRIRF